MPRLTRNVYRSAGAEWGRAAALAVIVTLTVCATAYAQKRPPLPSEPVATEGTVKQFYRGLNYVVVKTMDGVEHVYNFTKDLVVHGGKKPGVDGLEGLREGTSVAIHYSTTAADPSAQEIDVLGEGGLSFAEGVIAKIDRGRKEITIKFAGGRTETFQMTSRAAAESERLSDESGAGDTRIIIYYADESGYKVAHYFKKVS
ncbi:MAG TPA: hypothetical protein VIR54_16155 [Vicinamibacterales bacterium]